MRDEKKTRRLKADQYCEWCGRKKIILLDETRPVCPIRDCDQFSEDDNPFDSLELEITKPMPDDLDLLPPDEWSWTR